jgi:hypothetical protein
VTTASARPERLLDLADTTVAIAEGLDTRAGWMEDDWQAYSLRNGVAWRFDISDLPGAVRAWAQTVRAIGEFTGAIGTAFLVADDDDPGGRHELSEQRLHDLVPCAVREMIDESTADEQVDWGDPDDPPAWLEAMDFSAVAVGHAAEGVDALESAFVVGTGPAASWSPRTPAPLGRFATPGALSQFAGVFGAGSAGLSGVAAGLGQWQTDAGTLNFTDGEVAARATTRGAVTGGGSLAAGAGGVLVASAWSAACGPGAPVCAGATIVGAGLAGGFATDRALGSLVPDRGPAQRDPALVQDRVEGVAPGTPFRDIPRQSWDVIGPVEDVGDAAGLAAFEARHPYLDVDALIADPTLAGDHDLPAPWIELQVARSLFGG